MKTWITSIGIAHHAVVNTIWAAVAEKGWIPDRIYLLTNDRTKKDSVSISNKIEKIILGHGGKKIDFRVRIFDENDLEGLFRLYDRIIDSEIKEGNDLSVDLTPGRKFVSAFALYFSLNRSDKVQNLFYFHIFDEEYMDQTYPFWPVGTYALRNLIDLKEAIR